MNRSHPFAIISSALLLLCAVLASCSKDADSSARGERLPEGRYPIEFTAEGVEIEPFTRATVDGDWDGVESVAVCVYSRGNDVKRYSVTSTDGGKTAKLTSDDPFFWEYNGDECGVMAWYPYSDSYPSAWTVKADQSAVENYRASDLVEGRNAALRFAEKNDPSKNIIVFRHLTSKVVVNLVAGPGVILDGNTSVKFLNVGGVETGNTVTAYRPDAAKQSFHALLSGRQTITAGAPFIQVNVGSNVFVYTPSAERQLIANTSYTYTITVKEAGIEVKEAAGGEWTDGGSEDVTGRTVLVKYAADDVKKGDYIYKDGTTSDGGLRRIYSDGTMVCEATKPQPRTIKNNPVVGIVFWTPSETTTEGRQTPASLTDDKIMAADYPECTHGLAVALENISYEEITGESNYEFIKDFQKSDNFTHGRKSDFVSIASGKGATDNINRIYGYQNTIVLRAYNEYCTKNNRGNHIARNAVGLDEFAAYHPAPSHSTGWFIPSLKELHLLCNRDVDDIYDMSHETARVATRDVVNSSLSAANGTALKGGYYRSSSEYAEDCLYVYVVYFRDGSAFQNLKWYSQALKAVCAF